MLLSTLMLTAVHSSSSAQISLSINIGTQPTWGPVGYDRADYYYLPDVESYYNVSTHQFIYLNNGRWVFASNLPGRYSNYDLYSGYKVVVNRPRPYLNFSQDRVQYGRYRDYHGRQTIIRDSRDERYTRYHDGNPHGMPPGQAKKYDDRGDGYKPDDHGHDNRHDSGHGNDHGDKHDNGDNRGHGHDGN